MQRDITAETKNKNYARDRFGSNSVTLRGKARIKTKVSLATCDTYMVLP